MNRQSLPSVILALFTSIMVGCAADATDEESAPLATAEAALTTIDTGTGGVVTSTTTAEKPKFDLRSCIQLGQNIEGWSYAHAKAYCECRATGKSDLACRWDIPFIDL